MIKDILAKIDPEQLSRRMQLPGQLLEDVKHLRELEDIPVCAAILADLEKVAKSAWLYDHSTKMFFGGVICILNLMRESEIDK